MPTALLIIADGTEETEAIATADVLCRCGVGVTVAGVDTAMPSGRNSLPMRADITIDMIDEEKRAFDAVVVPGGAPGAERIAASDACRNVITRHAESGAIIAGICAGPALVLAPLGILDGKHATCFPGFEERFGDEITFSSDRVVVDGRVYTSRGPGTAIEFGLAVGAAMTTPETAAEVASAMLFTAP